MITKAEFVDWKNNPVTKEVMSILRGYQERIKEELAQSAGNDPLADKFRSGAYSAYTDMLDIQFGDDE